MATPSGQKVVRMVHGLLRQIDQMIRQKDWQGAQKRMQELSNVFCESFQSTGFEIHSIADRYRHGRKFNRALIFYKLASDYFSNNARAFEAAVGIRKCVEGLKENSKAMVETDRNNEQTIRNLVIPLMIELRARVQSILNLEDRARVINVAWCSQFLAFCYLKVHNWAESKSCLQEALQAMKATFGRDACRHLIVGHVTANLGLVCVQQRLFQDALKWFKEAEENYQQAANISEDYRIKLIQLNARNRASALRCLSELERSIFVLR